MADNTEALTTIPVAVPDGVIAVTYRPNAFKDKLDYIQNTDKAKDYAELVELFCSIVHDWNVTEVKKTRFKGRVVDTVCKVSVTKTRLLGRPAVPPFVIVYVLTAVAADWSAHNQQDGAIVAVEGEDNG